MTITDRFSCALPISFFLLPNFSCQALASRSNANNFLSRRDRVGCTIHRSFAPFALVGFHPNFSFLFSGLPPLRSRSLALFSLCHSFWFFRCAGHSGMAVSPVLPRCNLLWFFFTKLTALALTDLLDLAAFAAGSIQSYFFLCAYPRSFPISSPTRFSPDLD